MPRRLGQHFLNSPGILERIAAETCPERESFVIEIGPGTGLLTEFLLQRAERVTAVEIDRELVAGLRKRFEGSPGLEVIEGDVLETDLTQWGPAVVAGNLPYYITSPIIERLLAMGSLLRRAVLLVQKEVAQRLVAAPGTRDYGFLTVQTNVFTAPELLFTVPPGAFSPPPKVDSAVVRLVPRAPGETPVSRPADFLLFAGRCFRHKRKTLRNNLAPFYGKQVDDWPESRLRAEQMSLVQLAGLYQRVHSGS